jgi:hypothetical protein
MAIVALLSGSVALAQRQFLGQREFSERDPDVRNPRYDGRFTFARIRYTGGPGNFYYRGLPAWAHGYNDAERNLMKIMNEISFLNPRVDDTVAVALDDPELAKYPIAYMTEAGFWTLTNREAAAFRAYLLKGGFAIFDDFREQPFDHGGGGWENFEANFRRVLPGAKFIDLDPSDPLFHTFFEIDSLDLIPQFYDQGRPIFRGVFEDNDPKKRLMAIVNLNTDVANFWEFSAQGLKPINESNQAYKLGVDYLIYGLTH